MEVTSPMPVAAPAAAALPRRQVLIVFSGIMLGMLLAAIDQTIVATALPTIHHLPADVPAGGETGRRPATPAC
jgi:hypothetical protein